MDPRIADFIRANRKKYTRDVIREQLIKAGHAPADIDATWAALDAPDPDAVVGQGFWGRFWLYLVGVNVAVFLLVILLTGMLASFAQGTFVLAVVLAIALAIGALIAWGIVASTGPAQMGRTTATVIGGMIPLVFALLIGGSCYAMTGAIGSPAPPAIEGVMDLAIDAPIEFRGSGGAFCQPHGTSTGFSVYAQELGSIGDQVVTASVDSYATESMPEGGPAPAPGPGSAEAPGVYVQLVSRSQEAPQQWSATPESRIEIDAAPGGLSGTVTFAGLEAVPMDPPEPGVVGQEGDAMSGTITWTCE